MADDTFYMKQALMEAQKAFASGEFEIWVGASSKDIRLKTKVKM